MNWRAGGDVATVSRRAEGDAATVGRLAGGDAATEAALDRRLVVVTAVAGAEGSRGAAAALACAGADVEAAALLVDVGGRPPRPTLLTASAAQRLEERLAAHLPQARVAARGQVCHLAVAATPAGLECAAAAVTVARGALSVLHLPPEKLQPVLAGDPGLEPSGVLLRADLNACRPLLSLLVRDLLARDLGVVVLKRRLGWIAERRALFGASAPDAAGLPEPVLRRLGLLSRGTAVQGKAGVLAGARAQR